MPEKMSDGDLEASDKISSKYGLNLETVGRRLILYIPLEIVRKIGGNNVSQGKDIIFSTLHPRILGNTDQIQALVDKIEETYDGKEN
jgi:hypothetical protein